MRDCQPQAFSDWWARQEAAPTEAERAAAGPVGIHDETEVRPVGCRQAVARLRGAFATLAAGGQVEVLVPSRQHPRIRLGPPTPAPPAC